MPNTSFGKFLFYSINMNIIKRTGVKAMIGPVGIMVIFFNKPVILPGQIYNKISIPLIERCHLP